MAHNPKATGSKPVTAIRTDGRVVQGAALKMQYRKMRGFEPHSVHIPCSPMVRIWPFQGRDPGSIPGKGIASVAQLVRALVL